MTALMLRLAGPTQAWDSRRRLSDYDGRRGSYAGPADLMPTYSGVVGLLAAALGLPRDSDQSRLGELDIIVRVDQPGRQRGEFRTSRRLGPDGKVKVFGVVEQMLDDAAFLVGIGAPEAVLDEIEAALRRPAYPLFLGKRECPITLPLILGRSDLPVVDAVRSWPSIASEWARDERHVPAVFGSPDPVVLRLRRTPRLPEPSIAARRWSARSDDDPEVL